MKKFVKGVFLGAIIPLGMCGFAFTVYQASKKKYEELKEKELDDWCEFLSYCNEVLNNVVSEEN